MNTRDDGGPAFPLDELNQTHGGVCAQHFGMSLRDYFAAKAMHALIADPCITTLFEAASGQAALDAIKRLTCENSYSWADAMLAARSKT